jgi:hypothetical protein
MKIVETDYYMLASGTMDPWNLTKPAYELAKGSWACPGCGFPLPGVKGVDVTVVGVPDNASLSCVHGLGLGVADRALLESFGANEAERYLYLGKVFGPDGAPLQKWVTFNGTHRILVRGSKHATARVCPECGRQIYFAMGRQYLYPKPSEAIKMFDVGWGALVVTGDFAARAARTQWRKVNWTRLKVLREPEDGLGELLSP